MRYRVIKSALNEVDVLTENGGVATFYHNGDNYVTNYYTTNLGDCDPTNYVWDELSQSKVYIHDWDGEPTEEEVVQDALSWLVFPAPTEGWTIDDSLWNNFFNQ
jgi:hypothetical protein